MTAYRFAGVFKEELHGPNGIIQIFPPFENTLITELNRVHAELLEWRARAESAELHLQKLIVS